MRDDDVRPKLGRIRAKGGQSYLPKVLKAARKAGGLKGLGSGGDGKGRSRGRGAGISAVTAMGRVRGRAARRVIVKTRYTELAGKGVKAARSHLRYLQRDGVTQDGRAGELYNREKERVDGRDFMDRAADDPRQFRLIVSAEDGDKYEDLKPLTRRFMEQMESDLGTRLDWVAVDHFNTGHPHTHIVIRGVDDQGKDLKIARDYISEGMRDRLQGLVTLDLGPRTDREIDVVRRQEVAQARFTSHDRILVRNMSLDRIVQVDEADPKERALQVGRLAKLREFGLAEDLGHGQWRLAEKLDATLRELGERGDIIKSMHRELELKGMARAAEDGVIHRAGQEPQWGGALFGRVVKRGLLDSDTDRHFLMLDSVDGRVHWIDIGFAERTRPLADDALVRVDFRQAEIKTADHIILEVAAGNGGWYDVASHLNFDQTASEEFADTHVRRLEAIKRATRKIERNEQGAFYIGDDYLDQAMAYEKKRLQQAPADVEPLSPIPLSRLPTYPGGTWLDRELVNPTAPAIEVGFGKEFSDALRLRQAWLLQEEMAFEVDGEFRPATDMLKRLELRGLDTAAGRLEKESGLAYRRAKYGERVEGSLRQSIHLPSGRYAMVEQGREFTLVPWRSVLEKHLGKPVSGLYREEGINWAIGRSRGMGVQ